MKTLLALLLASVLHAQILTPIMFGVDPDVKTPTDSPGAGTYGSTQSVTLSDPSADIIRYTTDGSAPSFTAGTLYSGAFNISVTTTLKAIGCKIQNAKCGGVLTSVYTITATIPALVTGQFCHGAFGTNPTCSFPSNITTGNAVIVWDANTVNTPSLTGASFTLGTTNAACTTTGLGQQRLYAAISVTGGNKTVSVAGSSAELFALEVSGLTTGFDSTSACNHSNNVSSPFVSGTSGSPAVANEFSLCFSREDAAQTLTPAGPYTVISNPSSLAFAYNVVSASTSCSVAYTGGNGVNMMAGVQLFQ